MSLIYKSSTRENLNDIQTYVVDTSTTSPKYFRVSDVPSVLQKGKNLLRITAHPTNLVPGSQIYVDVRDSNGDPIYYEIPDYLEDDKSRVISIWVYHDKGDDNTPNGEATITLVGIANVDLNGNPLPERHRGKLNVKWQISVNVDRDRGNTSEIVFNSTTLPRVVVSQSVEAYQNQSQSDSNTLSIATQTGVGKYLFSGQTPVIQLTDGSEFNSEMVGGVVILDNYTEPAYPQTSFPNATTDTYYSSSIVELISPTAAKVTPKYVTTFTNLEGLLHTYQRVDEADYKIQYYTTGSNQSTENYRNFAVLNVSNVDPIAGVVDKVRILQKSDGISGEYELLNEVSVPYTGSFEIKVPIPSKNLRDPKLLKLLYINSIGGVSRTQTITEPYVFEGDNAYIGGSQNLITGSLFVANALDSGIEIAGVHSGFIRSVGFLGQSRAAARTGPGGFIIYSGSSNLIVGDDTLEGVGIQFIGDNDDRHLIFSTANGGILDVKTDKFFIGNRDLQFISGSNGNIEISSSIFHLDPENNLLVIGADAVINAAVSVDELFTPATINGLPSNVTNASSSIKSDGFARFVSASIGGFDVSDTQINSANNQLVLKSNGQITGSSIRIISDDKVMLDTTQQILDGFNFIKYLPITSINTPIGIKLANAEERLIAIVAINNTTTTTFDFGFKYTKYTNPTLGFDNIYHATASISTGPSQGTPTVLATATAYINSGSFIRSDGVMHAITQYGTLELIVNPDPGVIDGTLMVAVVKDIGNIPNSTTSQANVAAFGVGGDAIIAIND